MGKLREEFTLQKFSLSHEDPGRFTRSQWCPEGQCSLGYLLYRWFVACCFVTAIIGHLSYVFSVWGNEAWKWFIFMTQQGICILCFHYVFEAIIVTRRYVRDRRGASFHLEKKDLSVSHKASWALGNIAFSGAFVISSIYWGILHANIKSTVTTDLAYFFNIFMHGVNILSVLVDFVISDRPWRILHFYFPVIFGIWYSSFSLVYWAAGGTGFCIPRCDPDDPSKCPIVCDPYIYPILDYGNNLGLALAFTIGGNIFMPVIHGFYFLLYALRLQVKKRFCG